MTYSGDFAEDATVRFSFTTHTSTGALVAPSSAFAASDFRIYKNGSATEKTTTNGVTVTSPFDSITGKHLVEIDTSNDTGDAGFWTTAADYRVEINSAKTVDSISQSGVVIGRFSIQNRYAASGPTAAAIRDAILDRVLSGNHDTTGTTGKLLQFLDALISSRNATTPPTVSAVASQVRTELTTELGRIDVAVSTRNATTPPTAAAIRSEIDSNSTQLAAIVADTNELQTDWVDGGRLDLLLDSIIAEIVTTAAEPSQGAPPATASRGAKLDYLYKAWRNKKTQTGALLSVFADDGTTVDHKATIADDGTTATIGEMETGP